MQHFSRNVPDPAVLLGEFALLFVVTPEDPGEGHLGAQDSEGEGEEAISEVVVPGRVDDEPGRDGDRDQHEEEGKGEDGLAPRALFDLPSGIPQSLSGGNVCHVGPQSSFLVLFSVEVFSDFFALEPDSEAPFEESPLVVAASFGSPFGPFLS